MSAFSDLEIVEKALEGDTHAFRVLVERNQSFVCSLAYRFVGNASDAEDIAQEAFIRLWKNLNRYRPEIKLTTWLYKIVTNLCLDFLRSANNRRARQRVELNDHGGMVSEWTSDQSLLTDELRSALEMLSAELTPKQKAVFVLRDMEDLTADEVGEILAMSPGNVKSNLYYARKKMGEMITMYYQMKKSRANEL
ncbi:MAG: RNA polymerase sigma factor [Cyclobacteriaceae bacterium]